MLVILGGGRADHLSGSGYTRDTTPFLERLGREGVRFSGAISAAPSTLPALAALFTGRHSAANGVTDESPVLAAVPRTLAECMRAAGYATAVFSASPWAGADNGLLRGFDAALPRRGRGDWSGRVSAYARDWTDRLLHRAEADAGGRRTVRAFRRWVGARARPFFAVVEFAETRLPFAPPPACERLFLPRGATLAQAVELRRRVAAGGTAGLAAGEREILTASYDAALRHVDDCAGALAEALRAQGQWERTLFAVTADHGECLGEHGVLGHAVGLFDELLRVPLTLRCSARLPQGFVVDELVQTTDVASTVLAVAGLAEEAAEIGGRSLLSGSVAVAGPGYAIAERFRPAAHPKDGVRRKAIRTRGEKFIWSSDEENEFYDLLADPHEEHNRIESETARADALRRELFDWLATTTRGAAAAATPFARSAQG